MSKSEVMGCLLLVVFCAFLVVLIYAVGLSVDHPTHQTVPTATPVGLVSH